MSKCKKQFEVYLNFEVCNRITHFVESLQTALAIAMEHHLFFVGVEYSEGDEWNESPYATMEFFANSQKSGDAAMEEFWRLIPSTVTTSCNCLCPACEQKRQKEAKAEARAKAAA